MICKHCNQPIEKNSTRHSPEPNPHIVHKHVYGRLYGCYDENGKHLGTNAEPKEPS